MRGPVVRPVVGHHRANLIASLFRCSEESEDGKPFFFILRLVSNFPCLVLYLAFINGVSGYMRHKVRNFSDSWKPFAPDRFGDFHLLIPFVIVANRKLPLDRHRTARPSGEVHNAVSQHQNDHDQADAGETIEERLVRPAGQRELKVLQSAKSKVQSKQID